jgi:hypothetical protein
MSKIKGFMYDIEQLYIEGFSAKSIAVQLSVPYEEVLSVLEGWSVADSQHDEFGDYNTAG